MKMDNYCGQPVVVSGNVHAHCLRRVGDYVALRIARVLECFDRLEGGRRDHFFSRQPDKGGSWARHRPGSRCGRYRNN